MKSLYCRVIQSRTQLAGSAVHDIYATSPPSSSFVMGDTAVFPDARDNNHHITTG